MGQILQDLPHGKAAEVTTSSKYTVQTYCIHMLYTRLVGQHVLHVLFHHQIFALSIKRTSCSPLTAQGNANTPFLILLKWRSNLPRLSNKPVSPTSHRSTLPTTLSSSLSFS